MNFGTLTIRNNEIRNNAPVFTLEQITGSILSMMYTEHNYFDIFENKHWYLCAVPNLSYQTRRMPWTPVLDPPPT